jgi:hypothetical protein
VERRELGLGRPGARAVREKYQHKEAAGHSTAFGYRSTGITPYNTVPYLRYRRY